MRFWPPRVCTSQMPTTISVRRRSTPLKQSLYVTPDLSFFSISFVCSIMAIVSSGLNPGWFRDVKRISDLFAASRSFLRTCHHGDLNGMLAPVEQNGEMCGTYSGANSKPHRIGTGQTHWTPNGILYAHSSCRGDEPLFTATAKNWPITQHMLINVVR